MNRATTFFQLTPFIAALVLCVGGCKIPKANSVADSDLSAKLAERTSLHDRAETFWQARLVEDCESQFLFLSPTMQNTADIKDFIKWCREEEPLMITSYELGDVRTEDRLGWTEVKYQAKVRRFPDLEPREAQQWQKWHLVDDEWYPVSAKQLKDFPESPALRNTAEEGCLRVRFDKSWKARIAKDWASLYELVDPRDREDLSGEEIDVSFEEYAEAEALFVYISHKVYWVQVIGDSGTLLVTYYHKVADKSLERLPPRDLTITERWVKYDNEWYRDLK